jgi:hypothetical protein
MTPPEQNQYQQSIHAQPFDWLMSKKAGKIKLDTGKEFRTGNFLGIPKLQ